MQPFRLVMQAFRGTAETAKLAENGTTTWSLPQPPPHDGHQLPRNGFSFAGELARLLSCS